MAIKKLVINWWPAAILGLLSVYIMWVNQIPGTWLTGWDTLHPEFDFKLNFWRVLNGVWREDQGVGTLAAHSHMSELPRLAMLWVMSWVLPVYSLRYIFIAICFILGPLGVYAFTRQLAGNKKQPNLVSVGAFLAGLFYIFNLGTVQHFFVVFEMFAVAYAALPWLFYAVYQYTITGKGKWLVGLALVSFLGSPMAYASTLWFASTAGLGLFWLGLLLTGKKKVEYGKRGLNILIIILLVNTYWLLPNLYYLGSAASKAVLDAKINLLFSPESFLHNKAFGNLIDILLLRNFLFNWNIYDFRSGQFGKLLEIWLQQSEQFIYVGLGIMAIAGMGLFSSFRKSFEWRWALLLPMIMAMLVLVTDNPPLGQFFGLLKEKIPFLGEALRTPFTKFSLILMLVYSLYLGIGWVEIVGWINKRQTRRWVGGFLAVGVSMAIVVWAKPIVTANLVSQKIQQIIPNEYFDLYRYLDTQPAETRVALMPMPGLFGWEYNNWGYQGAGFLWFGMRQPLLVRDFDRWSPYNEGFYQEANTAINGKDEGVLKKALEKYRVSLVLVDDSLMDPQASASATSGEEVKELLGEMGAVEVWREGFLSLYQLPGINDGFVWAPEEYTAVIANTEKVRQDKAYHTDENYIEITGGQKFEYPLADIMTENLTGVSETDGGLTIIRRNVNLGIMAIPGMERGQEIEMRARVKYQDGQVGVEFEPYLTVEGGDQLIDYKLAPLSLALDKDFSKVMVDVGGKIQTVTQGEVSESLMVKARVGEPVSVRVYGAEEDQKISVSEAYIAASLYSCGQRVGRQAQISEVVGGEERQINVKDGSGCVSVYLGKLSEATSAATITVPYKTDSGLKPYFCVNRADDPNHTCVHDDIFGQESPSADWTEISRRFQVEPEEEYWVDLIVRPPETEGVGGTVSYLTPRISLSPLAAETQIDPSVWQEWLKERQVNLTGNELRLIVNTAPEMMDLAKTGKQAVENCDLFKRGEVSKNGHIYISGSRGAGCDGAALPQISNQNEYVMAVKSNNISGRPLKIYLRNEVSKRNDLETLLPKGEGKSYFGLLAWPKLDKGNYYFSLENRSFGREVAENRLEPIKFYQVPLTWLSGIKVIPEGKMNSEYGIENNLKVTETSKYGTGIYKAQTQGDGLLALGQGFDKGWIALSSGKILEHNKLNGWANAWKVNPPSPKATEGRSGWSNGWVRLADPYPAQRGGWIYIVYWPQLLEWLGLILLGGGLGFLGFKIWKKRE